MILSNFTGLEDLATQKTIAKALISQLRAKPTATIGTKDYAASRQLAHVVCCNDDENLVQTVNVKMYSVTLCRNEIGSLSFGAVVMDWVDKRPRN